MRRGEWKTISKVIGGGLLIGAGLVFVFLAGRNSNNNLAHAQSTATNYTAQWTATKLITINTNQLAVSVGAGAADRIPSSNAVFGIGPSEWVVNYCATTGYPCSGSQIIAEEKWDVTTAPSVCFSGKSYVDGGGDTGPEGVGPCDYGYTGGASHIGSYLYGIADASDDTVTNNGLSAYLSQFASGSVLKYTLSPEDPSLSRTGVPSNVRFQGIGAVPETNHGDNTGGWIATGAYGFIGADVDNNSSRSDVAVAGIDMPLQWTVTGTICNSTCSSLLQ